MLSWLKRITGLFKRSNVVEVEYEIPVMVQRVAECDKRKQGIKQEILENGANAIARIEEQQRLWKLEADRAAMKEWLANAAEVEKLSGWKAGVKDRKHFLRVVA